MVYLDRENEPKATAAEVTLYEQSQIIHTCVCTECCQVIASLQASKKELRLLDTYAAISCKKINLFYRMIKFP